MERKVIQFPAPKPAVQAADPVMDRAMFFMDLELAELTAVIPQAEPTAPKSVY